MNNTSVQQSFAVEFEEYYQQCDDCKKEYTPHTWNGLVQVINHIIFLVNLRF
jgi:nonsense-mediated mRNA decay protein 3